MLAVEHLYHHPVFQDLVFYAQQECHIPRMVVLEKGCQFMLHVV